jgi:hypothetical protein
MFRHVVVGNLARSDAWDALAIPLAASHRSFAMQIAGAGTEQTAGHTWDRVRCRRRWQSGSELVEHKLGHGEFIERLVLDVHRHR